MTVKKIGLKKGIKISLILLVVGFLLVSALWSGIIVREYQLQSDKLTDSIKLVLITDLHSTVFGKNQHRLIEKIEKGNPDIILLSGDIADDKVSHDGTKMLLSAIGSKYPCYYVSGNHEFWTNKIESVKEMISSYGITVLSGEVCEVNSDGQKILLGGVDDPVGLYSEAEAYLPKEFAPKMWHQQLQSVCKQNDGESFSVLLSHRPEQADSYSKSNFDLVVSGHAHGGQVRIPFLVNGLVAPNQGFFPEYAGGLYDLGETDMIVSRGLCVNWLPRVFNPPELVIINIEPK